MSTGKLSERAMLARLSVSSYSGMHLDKIVTEEVNESYKANKKSAGRYNKRLIDSQFLKGVNSAHSNARAVHKTLTLPWEDDGTRILTTAGYMNYTAKMRECRLNVEDEVKQFIVQLPDAIKEAQQRLGTMFSVEDYPDAAELKTKFDFDVEITNLPEAADFRAKLGDDTTKGIIKDIERRVNKRLENAMDDVFNRVKDMVGKMTERLRDYTPAKGDAKAKGVIRDSLVYNINELAQLLPTLNVTNDPRITALQKELVTDLVEHSPEILRADSKVRQTTISKAEKILKKVEAYLK